jgi:hypothetical protein
MLARHRDVMLQTIAGMAPSRGQGAPVRLRLLAILPVPLAASMVLLILGLGPASYLDLLFRIEGTAVKAIAAAGAAVAAATVSRHSRPRLAWAAIAACYAVLAAKTAPVVGDDLMALRLGTLIANVLSPLGSFLMVRAWYASRPTPTIPVLGRRVLPVVALAASLAVAGPGVVVQVRNLPDDPAALLLVFSGIGDIASVTLLAPLLLIANPIRSGERAWPWALLAAGELCWLLYDLVPSLSSLSPDLITPARNTRALAEVMRASACLFYASAGLAQGLALRPAASAEEGRAAA